MLKAIKLASVLGVTCVLHVSSLSPAQALSLIAPAAQVKPDDQGAMAAFASGAQGERGESFLLSKKEIAHVRWCAKRYLSYHATDNTYEMPEGARAECRSPD
ncbi:BA14K family protein [Rhizobium grahamii]|uniref:Lectin-like protein BA14k n=1 Tax=Rhizobium grahamii TaxID=1120045 RepID=A0A370KGG8_9HYPH|nr:BA14K family protein [Rhizobium grahamii]RDJ03874.1 hypothetical protein B5K06_28590 [Rhizobium grahamii]